MCLAIPDRAFECFTQVVDGVWELGKHAVGRFPFNFKIPPEKWSCSERVLCQDTQLCSLDIV